MNTKNFSWQLNVWKFDKIFFLVKKPYFLSPQQLEIFGQCKVLPEVAPCQILWKSVNIKWGFHFILCKLGGNFQFSKKTSPEREDAVLHLGTTFCIFENIRFLKNNFGRSVCFQISWFCIPYAKRRLPVKVVEGKKFDVYFASTWKQR